MKKLSIILCCLLLSISLIGCGKDEEKSNFISVGNRTFYVISSDEQYVAWDIYVDTETKVQYIYFRGDNSYCSAMSILVDADGKPILYEGSFN